MVSKQQSNWHLSFDISPDLTIRCDGRPCHKATAIARRGDLAYMAELELVSWAEDIAAFFEQVRSVFFEAEVNGLPAFPEMSAEASAESEDAGSVEPSVEPEGDDPPGADEPAAEMSPCTTDDPEYDIVFYPAEDEAVDTDQSQPSLL